MLRAKFTFLSPPPPSAYTPPTQHLHIDEYGKNKTLETVSYGKRSPRSKVAHFPPKIDRSPPKKFSIDPCLPQNTKINIKSPWLIVIGAMGQLF